MPLYKISAPNGKTYQIEGPDGASQKEIEQEVMRQHPMAAYTTQELENAPRVKGTTGDIARETGQGVLGGVQALTDIFGANNFASKYLQEKSQGLSAGLTPERQQELQIEQELSKRAEGDTFKEITTGLKNVLRHPFTSVASGLGSSVPLIAGTILAPEAAVGRAALGIGSLMGLGGQKGQNYQAVYDEAIRQNKTPQEAEALAQKAQEYSLQNAPGLAFGAGLGALEGAAGAGARIGKFFNPAQAVEGASRGIAAPTFGKALGKASLEGGGTEFLQGSGAQVAANMALSQAGFDTPLLQGAFGAGAHDALIGTLTGAAVSPMQLSNMKREYDQDQVKKLFEDNEKAAKEKEATQAKFNKEMGVKPEILALPAPAQEITEKPTDKLKNPLGNFTPEELGPERVNAIDEHRAANNKPPLKTYSIEDIVDAMPKTAPEAERAALNELVANKAGSTFGYTNQKVSAQDVLNAATQKGIDTDTQGFKDFLTRATGLPSIGTEEKAATAEAYKNKPLGLSELDMMTDAQRFVAQQSLLKLPTKEGETTILPTGTNATHYDQDQYLKALEAVDALHNKGKPATQAEALGEIKKSTGLTRDEDAQYLLRDAVRRGDFDLNENDEIVPAETATYLPEGHRIEETSLKEGEAPENYEVKAGDKVLSTAPTEAEAQAKLERYKAVREKDSADIDKEIAEKQKAVEKSNENVEKMEARGLGRTPEYQKASAAHANLVQQTNKEIGDLNRDKAELDSTQLTVKAGGIKPVKRKTFKLHKAKAGEAATQVGSYPTRQAAEQAITSNMSESELEDLAKDTRRRTLARRARQELNDRRTEKIKVRREFKQVSGDIAKEFESFLAKIGLKGVGLKLMSTLGGDEGEYTQSLIKVALDVKNPLGVLRHESIHALKDLGFFSDNQWNALRRMAKDKWIKQFMKDVPYSEGVSRYDAYKTKFDANPPAGVTFQEYIEEEAIADAFRYFHENGTPPGMIAAILKRLNQFFEALRNALNNGGFYTSDDIFEKIEKGELVSSKQGTAEAKASLKNTTKGLLNPSIPAKQEKILNDVVNEMGLTPEEFASTSLIHQTGKPGTEQFESDKIGGLPEVVQFLQDQRRQSGLPLLNVDKPEDRKMIAKLMATEAMAAIRSGGANLEWYDSIINKTLAMAGLKYPELNTDINARMAFRIATAITSQGLNVEDNLGFAMKVYDGFRQNGKFPEIGQGADQSAMANNFKLANYLLDDMGQDLMRQFLETEFTVEEMRSAGFDIKGELGDENVLGSSVFGPKIGFGFYSNLNGNFDPVTMDMWFMRTIGRLTGNLKSFRQDLYNAQLQKFRDEFDTEGDNGVFANQFNQEELDLAKIDDKAAEALARKVKSAHERDYKINRAGYDDKTRIKSPLVGASETMIKSLDAPRDAPSNGTERRNLRDVVRQMVDIVEEKYGKRVPPASLQAVIWYPEQELYKAMGVKLRVTSQNYAGAIEKILIGEGYDAGNLSAAAKLGSRTAQQLAKSAVSKGTQTTGAKPVRLGALQAEEKEALLERGRKRVVLEQEKETPKRKRVVFEVAPDPNNKALTDKWRGLSTEQRIEISDKIGNKIIKDALAKFGLTGYVDTQVGSYGDDTNPSFALYLDSGDSVAVAKFLGYALSQDSMMVISPKEGKGLDKTGAVRVNVGEASANKVNEIYQQLREIEVNGEKPVGGQSFMNGHMVILNYSNLETSELAKLINEKLNDQYKVITEDVYSAFPEKKDYDYANPSSDPRGNAGVLRQASRDLRSQATQLLQKELRGVPRYSLGSSKLAFRPSDRSDKGITLGQKQPDAVSFTGTHYGKEKTDVLNGDKYGTGIRGAERRRLENHWDDRVKRRVYFYIPKVTGEMPAIESGLGGNVYTQKFNNILGPGKEISRLMSEARGDANEFESAVVDAGYDGYAVPNMGMMVILNHDVPANYEGTASEVSRASLKGFIGLTDGRISSLINNYIYTQSDADKKTKGYIAYVSPQDFLNATATKGYRERLEAEKEPLDLTKLTKESQPITLFVDETKGRKNELDVKGHEGRHRMMALRDAGFIKVPVVFDFGTGEDRDPVDNLFIHPQKFYDNERGISGFTAEDLIPINYENRNVIKQKFSQGETRFSLKTPDTLAFKQWFGDSKIVNEDSTPKVMYHGTSRDFNVPITRGNRNAFFVTADPNFANRFAANDMNWFPGKPGVEPGANVMPVYIKASNPFDYENPKHIAKIVPQFRKALIEEDGRSKTEADEIVRNFKNGKWNAIEHANDFDLYEKNGFDAFYVYESGKNLAVFEPTQVKSATGNYGTYSATNPDIRASLKAPETPAFKRFFGDSKIVDKNGEPMVMYHATNSDFNVFNRSDDGKLGEGIYSTSIPEYANEFAPKGNIMPLYVHAENPFVINVTRADKARPERFSGDINKAMVKAVADFTDGKTRLMDLEGNQVRELFEKNGYDGIMVRDDQGNIVELNAFTPTQLKSAIGNTGTYSISNPDIRYSLAERLQTMPNSAAGDKRVNETTTTRDEVGHAQRMIQAIQGDTFSKIRQRFFNRYQRIGEFDKRVAKMKGVVKLLADTAAESAALMSDYANGVAYKALGFNGKGGVPEFKNQVVTVNQTTKGPVEIFATLAKFGDPKIYQYYQFWSGVQRGSRYIKNNNGVYEEKLFNQPADIQLAKDYEKAFPEFVQVQKEWIEYNNGLVKFLVDTGVLSAARANEFTKYSDYIPFYRQFDDETTIGPQLFQSMSAVKAPKRAKGGEAPLADFLETIVRNTQSSVQAGMKAVAAKRAIDNALLLGEAEQVTANERSKFDVIQVYDKGELKFYRVNDPLYLEAMKGLNLPEIPFLGILAKPADWLRTFVTKEPGFMLANMMKDSMQTYITSGSNMKPIIETAANFATALAGKNPTVERLKAAGLGGNAHFVGDITKSGEDFAKMLRKQSGKQTTTEKALKPFTSLWDALGQGTEASDLATRAAVYDRVMAETGNEAEAIFQAVETMNFYRHGNSAIVRILTAVTPFLNARMQGLDVFYRAGFAPTVAKLTGRGDQVTQADLDKQKTFMIRSAGVIAMSVAYWALTHDDDEYKKQEQETRDNNWLIPALGIKIPIPFEVGFLFKVLPERIMEYTMGGDTGQDFAKSMYRGIEQTIGLQFPQAILPMLENSVNYSFFTQRAIVPPGLENVDPEFQVGPSTSNVAEMIGKSIGSSPMKVDHLIKGYTGTLGMYLVDVIDSVMDINSNVPKASKRFEQMPFIKRFALDPEARGTVSSYYELKNNVDQVVRTINLLEKNADFENLPQYAQDNAGLWATHDFVLSLDKQMKEYQQYATMIRNSGMDADEKRDALSAVHEAQNALTSNIQYIRKMISQQ